MCKKCTEFDEFGTFADMSEKEILKAKKDVADVLRINNWCGNLSNQEVALIANNYIDFLRDYNTCSNEFTALEILQSARRQHGNDLKSYVTQLSAQ
jgi:hypothetical protein